MDFRTRQEKERIKLQQQQLAQQQLKKQMQSADYSRSDSAYDSISGSISELKAVPSDSLTSFQSIDETVYEIFSTKSDASEFYDDTSSNLTQTRDSDYDDDADTLVGANSIAGNDFFDDNDDIFDFDSALTSSPKKYGRHKFSAGSSGIKLRFYSSSSFSDLDPVVYWPYGNAISTLGTIMLRIRESRRYHDSLKRVTFGEIPNSKPEHYRHFSNDEPVFDDDLRGLAYHNNWKDFIETTSAYKISGKVWEFAEILEKIRQNCKWNSDFAPGSQINESPDFGPLARIPNSYELEHGAFGTRIDTPKISPSRTQENREDIFSKLSLPLHEDSYMKTKLIVKESSIDPKNTSTELISDKKRPEIETFGQSDPTSVEALEISQIFKSFTSSWANRHIEKFPYPKEYQIATDSITECQLQPAPVILSKQPKCMTSNQLNAVQSYGSRNVALPSNVSKEMITFGLQNSRGDKISIELTCVTSHASRFWDWDLFCLADDNGFGIKFISIRIWRENDSSPHPSIDDDQFESNDWFKKLFAVMVRQRREVNSLDQIFSSEHISSSNVPRTLESIVDVSDPEWSRREDNFKFVPDMMPTVNDVESFFASVRVRKANVDGENVLAFADFNPEWQKSTKAEFQALTPQEMSDFDQMDSIGEYPGDETTDASIDYELGPFATRKNNEIGFESEKFTQTKSELPRHIESPIVAGHTDTRAANVDNAGHDGIDCDDTNESIIDLEAAESDNKKDFWEDVYEKVDVLEKSGFRNTAREDLFNELKEIDRSILQPTETIFKNRLPSAEDLRNEKMEHEDIESGIDTESGIGLSTELSQSEIDISMDQSDDVFGSKAGTREFEREKIRRPSQTSTLTVPLVSPKSPQSRKISKLSSSSISNTTDEQMITPTSFNVLKEISSSSRVSSSTTSSEIETTKDLIKVKLHLPNEAPRKVQIFADFNGWQAVEMFCSQQVWQVALPPHTGDYRFMIQSQDGGYRWFTNPKSTQIKRDSGCNNVNYFENNEFVQLQHEENKTTIRIKTNQICHNDSNYNLFSAARSISVFTNLDWKRSSPMTIKDNSDWIISLPIEATECKFLIDGHIWSHLDQLPFLANEGWNCNNVINVPIFSKISFRGGNFQLQLKNNQSRRNLLTYQNECELNRDSLGLVTSINWNHSIDLTFDRTKPGLRFGQIGLKSHRLEFKFKNSQRLFTIGSLSTLSSNQWNENHILYPSE